MYGMRRRSVRSFRRRGRRVNYLTIMLLCVVLPVAAIYFGLKITEKWVSPVLNPGEGDFDFVFDPGGTEGKEKEQLDPQGEDTDQPEEKQEETEQTIQPQEEGEALQVMGLSIYTIQIASLGDVSSVDSLLETLETQSLSNLVYRTENGYKVFVRGATNRAALEGELEAIRALYPDAYIHTMHIPEQRVVVSETVENKAFVETFNELIKNLNEQGIAWDNFFEKEGDLGNYSELLKKQQEILSSLEGQLNSGKINDLFATTESFEKLITYQKKNIEGAQEILAAKEASGDHRLHSLYLDSLFRIVEVIK